MKKFILVSVLILLLLFTFSCDTTTGPEEPTHSPIYYYIRYEVTGTADTVNIVYENEWAYRLQLDAAVPWLYFFEREEGEFVYIFVRTQEEFSFVTVTIYKDNEIFKSLTKSGKYLALAISGSL